MMPGHSRQPTAHRPMPMRRLAAILLVMTIVVAALWTLIEQVSDDRAPDDPAAPPTSIAETGPGGTPNAADARTPGPGSLPDLLRYAPDRLGEDRLPLTGVGHYADISAWMNQAGVSPPAGPGDPALAAWEAELATLAIPASLGERGLDPIWEATYGFSLFDVGQVLVVGQAPDYVMVLRGAFDASALQDAWVRNGYQAVEVRGTTVWSLYPEDAIDLSSPASRPSMGALNNVTLLPDGTLITAARLSRMAFALEAIDGGGPSLADNGEVSSLLEAGSGAEQFVSAIIARGEILQILPSGLPRQATPLPAPAQSITGQALDGAATATRLLQMPKIDLVIVGIVPAGAETEIGSGTPVPSSAMRFRMILSTGDGDAGRNAREVIARRLGESVSPITGTSYLSRFGAPRVVVRAVSGGRAAVTIDAALRRGASDWLTIVETRDLGFAMWIGPAAGSDDDE